MTPGNSGHELHNVCSTIKYLYKLQKEYIINNK